MKRFKKIAVIDNIIFFPEHLKELGELTDLIVWNITATSSRMTDVVTQAFVDGPACNLEIGHSKPTIDELIESTKNADAIITCWTNIPNELIDMNPELKYIGFWTNLYSHRINEEYVKSKGIHIDYIPDYGTDAVAEFVFAGLMELARKTHKRYLETKQGKWMYENLKSGAKVIVDPDEIEEWTLSGKKMAIIGMGRIGMRVAEIAKYGFNMDVAYFSRSRKHDAEIRGIHYMNLLELVSWADIISCHLPPDAPVKLIDEGLLSTIKPNSIFINTGSGHSVDQEVLIKMLKQGKFNAFLDVYDGLPPRKELKDLPNALFTYRAAWFTKQSISYKANQLISKMREYLMRYE